MREEGRVGASASSATAAGNGAADEDWAAETAGRLDELIAKVRSQTTDRLVSVARLVVFGLLAAVMGAMAVVLLLAAVIRALDELIPQEVWVVYLGLGAIFTGLGLFLWSKKERPPSAA